MVCVAWARAKSGLGPALPFRFGEGLGAVGMGGRLEGRVEVFGLFPFWCFVRGVVAAVVLAVCGWVGGWPGVGAGRVVRERTVAWGAAVWSGLGDFVRMRWSRRWRRTTTGWMVLVVVLLRVAERSLTSLRGVRGTQVCVVQCALSLSAWGGGLGDAEHLPAIYGVSGARFLF